MADKAEKSKPTSKKRGAVLVKAAMEALDAAGGGLPLKQVKVEVEKRVKLDEHDRVVYEKSGYIRWQSVLHFYSIPCVKVGFIKKDRRRWYLTPEGKAVLSLPADKIIEKAIKGYREWKAQQKTQIAAELKDATVEGEDTSSAGRSLVLETAEAQARQEIEDHIRGLNPYEFQDLVAALLRGLGYATPYTAPKGPDGGTDILAYPDPLGTTTPHIRVQVKHRRDSKVTRDEVAALRGVIHSEREVGLFVSSAGFTTEAVREARSGNVHIELMDMDGFLEHWITQYEKLSEEDRGLLRLKRVHFLSAD